MPLAQTLADFKAGATQCETLIANAHKTDAAGAFLFPPLDQEQITVAALLNLFVAWETFLEASLASLMIGSPTISGTQPVRYVSPPSEEQARAMLIGVQRYFDYGNHEFVRKIVNMYFQNGYPFEPHLSSIHLELTDLRTMRNSSAHISSTTQIALEALANRVFSGPRPGISLYSLLTSVDPRSAGGATVFREYKTKLEIAASLIASVNDANVPRRKGVQ